MAAPAGIPLILKARWVLPISAPPLERAAVLVRQGRVERVGDAAALEDLAGSSVRTLDFGDAAILPGLVNAHTHLELTAFRGRFEGLDFFPWIRDLSAAKERLNEADYLASARWGALEALYGGVTTVADCTSSGQVGQALTELGLRGIVYQEVFGPAEAQCDAAVQGLCAALERQSAFASDRIRLGVSPHAAYTVSGKLFHSIADLALGRRLPVAVHAAESRAEGAFLRRGDGPIADRFRERGIPWAAPGASPVQYLEQTGLLAAQPLLIHAIDVDRADLERIRAAGASMVHCPKSNAKLCHGIAPLLEVQEAGVRVGLGTDGAVSSNNCDLFEEARCGVLLQRVRHGVSLEQLQGLTARSVLRLMTLGGAEALGLQSEIGSLEPGKRADLTVVGLRRPHVTPVEDPETAILFSASAQDVLATLVDGVVLFENGQATRADEAQLRSDVVRAAARLRA